MLKTEQDWPSQLSNYLTITTIWLSDNHNNLTHHVRFTDWLKNSNLTQHYRNTWLTHGILAAWYFVIYNKMLISAIWCNRSDNLTVPITTPKKIFSISQHCNIFIYEAVSDQGPVWVRSEEKIPSGLNQLLTSFFQCHNLPWSHSFQKRYDMYIVKING